MSHSEKVPFGQSMGGKAAAAAMALAGSLFLTVFLIATLPDKYSNWEKALPAPGMSAADAETALLRARYLHEATVRPQLILAGFFSPDDAGGRRDPYRGYNGDETFSGTLTDALWTFRAFPALHDAFLTELLDAKTSNQKRLRDFYLYGGFLAAIANTIPGGGDSRYRAYGDERKYSDNIAEWFAYFVNDPRLKSVGSHRGRRDIRSLEETDDEARLFAERLAFGRAVLPEILAVLKKDMITRTAFTIAEKENKASRSSRKEAWGNRHDRERYLEDLNRSMAEAIRILWKKRADPSFASLAREIIASDEGSLLDRYDLIPLAAKQPGLPVSEYFFWRKYKSDLSSVTSCVGTEPVFYAYLLGCMDKLMTETTNQLKSRGTFILSGHSGPGVTMTRTDTLTPGSNLSGKLYLLVDMDLALKKKGVPKYDLSRTHPIFQGMLYRHMERQPLVLPLNPSSPQDAALIDWYAQTGWKEGRALLFSAVGSAANVAQHWGLLHLLWWESNKAEKDDEPPLAYLHPESGHFMAGLLPALQGKAVTRFLGPITALWFGIQDVNETGWIEEKYEARPEMPPAVPAPPHARLRSPILDWFTDAEPDTVEQAPPAYSEATATVLVDGDIRSALNKSFGRNNRVRYALDLDEKYHDPTASPKDVLDFVVTSLKELDKWGIDCGENQATAMEYLWRFRNDANVDARVRDILSQEDLRPYERMRKLRRVLGLTETKGS